MTEKFFKGVTTALITPFNKGEIDYASLKRLVAWQLDRGIQGFVVCGSTGEAATLSFDEKKELLKFVLSEVDRKVPVIIGSGTFNTKESCELARAFEGCGADGLLVVTPYYNKPPQRGLVEHFKTVAQSTRLPIILYNVPSRTAVTMNAETVFELAKEKNIVGVKEAAGVVPIFTELKLHCPKSFSILSGDDGTFVKAAVQGADGVISVVSHVIPQWCLEALKTANEKNQEALSNEMSELVDVMFCESNPIPLKWALQEMGLIASAELRLPLVELDPKYESLIKAKLKQVGAL